MKKIPKTRMSASSSRLLRRVTAVAASLTLVVGLAACAGSTPDGDVTETAALADSLTFGSIGGSTDSISPYPNKTSAMTLAMGAQLYEGLTRIAADGSVEMALAESMEPNETLDVWTVHLRSGVKKHDGTDFGADDVLWSLGYILDADNAYGGASEISFVDPDKITKIDDLTVEIGLTQPYGPFPAAMASKRLLMAGANWSEDAPVGTGPFVLDTFTAGQQATFTRFDDYWGDKPGFTDLTMITFQDQSALSNALRGGQVQVISTLPFAEVEAMKATAGIEVLESENATKAFLSFRVDIAPFDDERVREAMRLIADREQIVSNAYGGYATVANDINGNNTSCPAPDVPQREQDLTRAKELLDEAGVENLEIEIVTDNGFAGMLEFAQLYAQQAAEVGVTVKVTQLDSAAFLAKWREWPALVSFASQPYITLAKRYYMEGGENNASHWADPEYAELAAKLYATADEDEQCTYIQQMQEIEYERGVDIVAAFPKTLVPYSSKVHGLKADLYGRSSYTFTGVTVEK
ncbi:ABC transporter substrate-binding protein [Microbacterium sp.]|uniref:ABC transporter substrate-binding protein n=1 Tax=Microbacterium sp. TaxID=51671 RepID=UPI0039E32B0D